MYKNQIIFLETIVLIYQLKKPELLPYNHNCFPMRHLLSKCELVYHIAVTFHNPIS